MQTDLEPILDIIDVDTTKLNKKDLFFKLRFEDRFKYSTDQNSFNSQPKSSVDSLVNIFKEYWRVALLNPDQNYDSLLMQDLNSFLDVKYTTKAESFILDSCVTNIDSSITDYVSSRGYYSIGLARVGRLYDLLIWKTQIDTIYTFSIKKEEISAKVIFLEDFISLGWGRYATLDKNIGGWADEEALYCVTESYDIESDEFKIHYLAHEGRHFEDYKIFPNLSGYDLEYRAKLTELSLAQETIFPLIEDFISSANYDDDNQHPVANYVVIKKLSKKLFNSEFEDDIEKWKALDIAVINETAYTLLIENTEELHNEGDDIEFYIKKFEQ